ncbi:MAG: hypothetical protein GY744_03915 [Gammaproteobacteria bacterium]|nr:hypothetical protein [Gammaproteobacteria bacterium]
MSPANLKLLPVISHRLLLGTVTTLEKPNILSEIASWVPMVQSFSDFTTCSMLSTRITLSPVNSTLSYRFSSSAGSNGGILSVAGVFPVLTIEIVSQSSVFPLPGIVASIAM